LRILNERTFENGDGALVKVPLLLCVAASNEWPNPEDGGKELLAVFDRFLFRKSVKPILGQTGRQRLLWTRDHTPRLSTSITPEEVLQAGRDALSLPWSTEGKEALEKVLRELAHEGIQPGDRRQFKAVSAAQGFAYLNGATEVEPEHLEVLTHVLWDDPIEQPEKCASIIAKIANPSGMRVNGLLIECEQVLAGTDFKDLTSVLTGAAKLSEIDKALAALKPSPRVQRARAHVKEQDRRFKLASLDSV
jgi:MoxR-like ATPase